MATCPTCDTDCDALQLELDSLKAGSEEEIKELKEELAVGNRLYAQQTDRMRDLEMELATEREKVRRLREGLVRLQYAPTEDSCEVFEHPETDDNDEHHNSCCGCFSYKCEGCTPACWLAALLKETEP